MRPSTTRLMVVLLAGLTLSGAAQADQGRGRTGQQRAAAMEQHQPASRPAIVANVSSTVQTGRGNAAGVAQVGTGNDAAILQFGRSNTGTITQVGSGNTACLIQSGRNLDGAIQQVGDNQSSGLLQTRWGSNDIPVELCASATTRQDLMEYFPQPSQEMVRARMDVRGRGRPDWALERLRP